MDQYFQKKKKTTISKHISSQGDGATRAARASLGIHKKEGDGGTSERADARPPDPRDPLIEMPSPCQCEKSVHSQGGSARRKDVQAVRWSYGELCHHALRPHAMMRHGETFAKHVGEHDEREKKIAGHSHHAQEATRHRRRRQEVGSNAQNRQKSNNDVHKQDTGMSKDNKERQDTMEQESNVTVSRNRETQDDDNRDSKRQRLSSVATHHSKLQHTGVLKYLGIRWRLERKKRAGRTSIGKWST